MTENKHLILLKIVLKHKYLVFKACRLEGLSFKTAILHDIDKFYSDEWQGYVIRHEGSGSYDQKLQRALKNDKYNMAWHLHQKRNQHHWQWWTNTRENGDIRVLKMSVDARSEMMADWLGMNDLSYQAVSDWYYGYKEANRIQLHPETENWVERHLRQRIKNVNTNKND